MAFGTVASLEDTYRNYWQEGGYEKAILVYINVTLIAAGCAGIHFLWCLVLHGCM